ncbi:hypothetical protein OXPF_23920 [Oxobacter pfennigii]|uniref:DUF4367 domain-containing protein n=1 Tax=Oxobacter pfennigii TaxID=36849 RepID=A0A0N8NT97_9CLOT|nr:hypothetical protein [Oxobacter pfennigii]KPU44224.1 hypothetical protein OXPF_23920 [Oxobacter pfennigii]
MWYRRFKYGTLMLSFLLIVMLSKGIKQEFEPQAVMSSYGNDSIVDVLSHSIKQVYSIEYKQTVKTMALGNKTSSMEMHYYYIRPYYLRCETSYSGSTNIDIYTPEGVYEYLPQSKSAYYREKWKDDAPIYFQLEEKLQDMEVSGKYQTFKKDEFRGQPVEIIRCIDDDNGEIYEHRMWLAEINGLRLPLKEEFLADGEMNSICEYEYITVNKNIDMSLFALKDNENIKIYNMEGIPKLVSDEKEAEKYVKFNVLIPKTIPKDFSLSDIYIIPPAKAPSVLISYIKDDDTINFIQKKTQDKELAIQEGENVQMAEGQKFAVKKYTEAYAEIRWIKNGIEYEVSGSFEVEAEIIKLIQSISGIWISIK